jgi:hypothetical protein
MTPLQQISDQILAFLPNLGMMALVVSIGIALAVVVRKLLMHLLRIVRFNDFAFNVGFTTVLFKANVHHTPASLVANIVYGLVLITALLLGLSALNLSVTSAIVTASFGWFPNVFGAVIILVAGYLFSKFIARSVLLTAVNAEIRSARLISFAVQALIMVFTVAIGMEQVGIGQHTIIAAFSILFGGLVLALSLAFGLGGRDLAREFLERQMKRSGDTFAERHPFSHL